MQSPITCNQGDQFSVAFSGFDEESPPQPYSNYTVQDNPAISDPTVLTAGGNTNGNRTVSVASNAGGKSATITWVLKDNNDPSKAVSLVDTFNVNAPLHFLASATSDYTKTN